MNLKTNKKLGLTYGLISLLLLIAMLPIGNYDYYLVLRWIVTFGFILCFIVKVNDDEDNGPFFAAVACIVGVWFFRPINIYESDKSVWYILDFFAGIYFSYQAYKYLNFGFSQTIDSNDLHTARTREKWRKAASEQTVDEFRVGMHRFDKNYFSEEEIKQNKLSETITMICGIIVMGVIVYVFYLFSSRNG